MRTVAIIPARWASSRFPGKPLALIGGKPMVRHVYERVMSVIPEVYVATDDERIYDAVKGFGGRALMTSEKHCCGTDRLAECALMPDLGLEDGDLILNIQGDEPLIRPEMVRDLVGCFEDPQVVMGTLKKEITRPEDLNNPNVVKVATDLNGDALYFSRFCIPFERGEAAAKHYKHIGVYGYKKDFLLKFSRMQRSSLEISESLEQLRVLENGYRIRVRETIYDTVGVDTPQQLKEVEKYL